MTHEKTTDGYEHKQSGHGHVQPGHEHQQGHEKSGETTPETGWEKTKRVSGKVWHFIWHEDSLASWIVNILLAFILIKFIVYPVLGLALGTGFPIVAVVSGSMEHGGTFDDWWSKQCSFQDGSTATEGRLYERMNISHDRFKTLPFNNGFNKGDLMILYSAKNADVGDVLVYQVGGISDPIIHRIVQKRVEGVDVFFETKGDANCGQNSFERSIPGDKALGKAVLRIPLLGWIKIGFVNLVNLVKCSIYSGTPACQAWWASW